MKVAMKVRYLSFLLNFIFNISFYLVTFQILPEKSQIKFPHTVGLKNLNVSETTWLEFRLQANKIGNKTITVNVSFTLDREKPLACFKSENCIVSVVEPFDVSFKFLSCMFEEVRKLYVDEDFIVMPVIESSSPWSLILEDTCLSYVNI